ncbi:MAG: MFS transporter [Planctomycetota bacterium]
MNFVGRAVEAVRASPRPVRAFLLGSVLLGAGCAFFEVLFNLYLQEIGLTKSEIGAVLSQRAAGTVLGAIAAGSPLQRKRPSLVFVISAFLVAASLFLLVYAPSPLIREAAATLYGFGVTFRFVGAAPFIFKNAEERNLTILLGVDASIIFGAQFLGSVFAGGLFPIFHFAAGSDASSLRGVLLIGVVLVAAGGFVYLGTKPVQTSAQTEMAARAAPSPKPTLILLFKLCFPFALVGAGAGLTIPYLNLYFEDRFQAQPSTISIYYAAVSLATTAVFFASPWMADRIGIIKSVVLSELLSIPFFIILAYSTSLPLSVAAFLMRGALMNLPYPLYGNFIMRAVGAEHREFANSLTKLAWNGSWVVTSRIAGELLDKRDGDYTLVMLISAGLYFFASTSLWGFFRKAGY